jgi:FADH2 O2-dependent halogenase
MTAGRRIAIVGSGFSGSLIARILSKLAYDVVLLERGSHPRFAIGESTTPLANLSLERLARRYDLADCYRLAAHGRWLQHHPALRRGIKRGFTFYRHHPFARPDAQALSRERLLVAANPNEAVADTHWLRADVDHHFVRSAIAAGVDYRDHAQVTSSAFDAEGVSLSGLRDGEPFDLRADFVIDASGPDGFIARQLPIPSGLDHTLTRSGVLFSHFRDVALTHDAFGALPAGPYEDDWAAVHHIIDEGWMYSLRFDDGVTSAGFVLKESTSGVPDVMWERLLDRYPAIGALFRDATPLFPLTWRPRIQHRLTRSVGERWALLPHAYAFVDPLFSTGIAWSLRSIERLVLAFEANGLPSPRDLSRYDAMLAAEADQIDCFVAGAYEAMKHFDLFAAHAMIYFTAVSFAEVRQRVLADDNDAAAWSGFLGVGDPVLAPLPRESLDRLRSVGSDRDGYVSWVRGAIEPRNIGGFGDPARENRYPVDLDVLLDRHAVLGLTRDQLVERLPALRGMTVEPAFA